MRRGPAWGWLLRCLVTAFAPTPAAAGTGQAAASWRERLSLRLESAGEGCFGIDRADCGLFANRPAAPAGVR